MSDGQFISNGIDGSADGKNGSSSDGSDESPGPTAHLKPENIDGMVRDAEFALGGQRRSPSDDGGSSQYTEDVKLNSAEAGQSTDFRRGQRFKRVSKMLMGEATLRNLKIFKYQAWGTAMFTIVVNVACFVSMYILLSQQQINIVALNAIGEMGQCCPFAMHCI